MSMKIKLNTKYIKYLPHLEIYLSIPFLTIRTMFLRESTERATWDICRFQLKIFKWRFELDIYYPFY